MLEEKCDIWERHRAGYWVCVTTNGLVKQDGRCVMGRGVAKQAATRYPRLPRLLGTHIKCRGNHVYAFPERIFSFPVKHNWWEAADLELIRRSAIELVELAGALACSAVYLPRPGCGNGRLAWPDVSAAISTILDDRFIAVTL